MAYSYISQGLYQSAKCKQVTYLLNKWETCLAIDISIYIDYITCLLNCPIICHLQHATMNNVSLKDDTITHIVYFHKKNL